jgi:hypothetical protein
VSAIAALALSLAAVTATGAAPAHAAAAAEACHAAPKGTAPAGSHWYYRIDRAHQRKCWYLGAAGQKVRSAPQRAIAQATEVSEPVAAQPSTNSDDGQPAQQTMMESKASLAEPVAASVPNPEPSTQIPDRVSAERKEDIAAAPPAPVQVPASVYERVLPKEPVQQPAVAVADQPKVTSPADGGTGRYVFAALAAISCIAGAIFLLLGGRRQAVSRPIVDLSNRPPLRQPKSGAQAKGTPPGADYRVPDERMEEKLLAFTQAWRNKAA